MLAVLFSKKSEKLCLFFEVMLKTMLAQSKKAYQTNHCKRGFPVESIFFAPSGFGIWTNEIRFAQNFGLVEIGGNGNPASSTPCPGSSIFPRDRKLPHVIFMQNRPTRGALGKWQFLFSFTFAVKHKMWSVPIHELTTELGTCSWHKKD